MWAIRSKLGFWREFWQKLRHVRKQQPWTPHSKYIDLIYERNKNVTWLQQWCFSGVFLAKKGQNLTKQSEEAWVRFMFLTDSGTVWKLWQSFISFPDIILIQHLLHITCFWQPVMKWGKGLAKRVFLPWGCQREILCCRDSRQVFVTWGFTSVLWCRIHSYLAWFPCWRCTQ